MTTWTEIAGWTLVHFLWQGALLAAIAAGGLTMLRHASPQTRYALASTTLVVMLMSPPVTATWLSVSRVAAMPARSATALAAGVLPTQNVTPLREDTPSAASSTGNSGIISRDRAFAVLVTMWLLGVVLLSLRLLLGWWDIRRLQRVGRAVPASRWQAVADRLAGRLGLRRPVHVAEVVNVEVPTVIGWWRPVMLLPIAAFAGLTPMQAEAVLIHELAHIRRHDYLVNVLQHVAETVLFYHPAVWWISRRMRTEREHCCDAVAIRLCGDAHEYARALVRLEEARTTPSVAFAVASTARPLVNRIRRIVSGTRDRHQPLAHAVTTTSLVLGFVLVVGGASRWSIRTVNAIAPARVGDVPAMPKQLAQIGTPVPGRLAAAAPDWRTYTTEHFDIFFTADLTAQVGRVEQVAERAYQHVSSDLRHDLDMRPALLLFATSAAARAATGASVPNVSTQAQRIVLPLDRPGSDFQAMVVHEITHAFEFNIVPSATLTAAPTWIAEGLSEYEGGAWGTSDQALLRGMVRADAVPALSMIDGTFGQDTPRSSYSVGHAAFEFIAARWGLDGVRRLFLALRNGSVNRQMLYPAAWGINADDVDRAFAAYVRARFPATEASTPPDLPRCLQDAGLISVDLKDVTIPEALTSMARECGVAIHVDETATSNAPSLLPRVVPRVQFNQTRLAEAFRFLVDAAGLRYAVLDEQTVILTRK